MSYDHMLIHSCDVYHLKKDTQAGKYGLPSEETYAYPEAPDIAQEPCYFYRKQAAVIQLEPNQQVTERYMVHFSPRSAIKHNDKVIYNDVAYVIRNPLPIRGHHIEAEAERMNL